MLPVVTQHTACSVLWEMFSAVVDLENILSMVGIFGNLGFILWVTEHPQTDIMISLYGTKHENHGGLNTPDGDDNIPHGTEHAQRY